MTPYNYYTAGYEASQPQEYGAYIHRMPMYNNAKLPVGAMQPQCSVEPMESAPGTYTSSMVQQDLTTPISGIGYTAPQCLEVPTQASKVAFS